MSKILSAEQLNTLKVQFEPRFKVRLDKNFNKNAEEISIRICMGSSCIGSGAIQVKEAFEKIIAEGGLSERIKVLETISTGCHGLCAMGPIILINPGDILYTRVKAEDVPDIVEKHLINGEIIERLLFHDPNTGEVVYNYENIPFYRHATRRILKYNGFIDPWSIEEYIAAGGYEALARALTQMTPDQVIEEIKKSGIRGRGGAGFPTATKWAFVRNSVSDEKYIVCNGDEGDPGAYMNRSVLEGNPHSVVEGMIIGAYAIGNVRQSYAYVRAEYPLAIKTLTQAIKKAKEYGFLGEDILGTSFDFDIDIFPGAGAFVCGEETALLTSIEGKRGNPRQRPPFPANNGGGLFGKPTAINNVETWANIPVIIKEGADWFKSVGSERSGGTKTFSLVGKINNTGLVEVPLGTPVGKLIFDIGGGPLNGKKFKAVQLGGPSGGVIPAEHLNTPVDYESVSALGAIMGSGGVVIMDEDTCMVDVAKYFLEFTKDESCGKCISCREGNPKMYDILSKITQGKATMDDLETLEELASLVKSASICGLGQTSPNPVLTTLRYFRDEYEAHIIDKKCSAAVCQALFKAPCQHTCPVGLDIPGYISLIKEGKYEQAFHLIMQRMPFPMSVGRVCTAPCQSKCRRAQSDEALAIRHLKRFVGDYAFKHKLKYKPEMKAKKPQKVAVIGSGPAGLSAAWDLTIEGYRVTIFEALPVAGGMMTVGIPEYRLPRKVLNYEIDNIRKLGVRIKLNTKVTDIPALLKNGYKAVLIAVGSHKPKKLNIPGEEMGGCIDAIDFLRAVNLKEAVAPVKRVAITGGGNSAVDAARVALRNDAEEVHILYRREIDDMPAEKEEIAAALQEGIIIHTLVNPVKLIEKAGKVAGVECVKMELKAFDKSGRKKPEPVSGSEFSMEIDTFITAIGQEPETVCLNLDGVQRTDSGKIIADRRTLLASEKGIFVCGDAFTGPATAVEAIASGQRAASSIKRFLKGEAMSLLVDRNNYKPIEYSTVPPSEAETGERPRVAISELSVSDRKNSFKEVIASYTVKEARTEASRCLRCDLEIEE